MAEGHGDRNEALLHQAADVPPEEQRALLAGLIGTTLFAVREARQRGVQSRRRPPGDDVGRRHGASVGPCDRS